MVNTHSKDQIIFKVVGTDIIYLNISPYIWNVICLQVFSWVLSPVPGLRTEGNDETEQKLQQNIDFKKV